MDEFVHAAAGTVSGARDGGHRRARADGGRDLVRLVADFAAASARATALALIALPSAAIAAGPDPAGPVAAAGPGAPAQVASADPSRAASAFTLRRVTNPRYRAPAPPGSRVGPAAATSPGRIDHARLRLAHRRTGTSGAVTDWEIAAGEQYRNRDAIAVTASGVGDEDRAEWRTMRVEARFGSFVGVAGDAAPIAAGALGTLQRMRGLALGQDLRGGLAWRAIAGVPTPAPAMRIAPLNLAGIALSGFRHDESTLSLALFGFRRGRGPSLPAGAMRADTMPGGGAAGTLGARAPLPLGAMTFSLGAQFHDLDGRRGLAAHHALGWTLGTRSVVIALDHQAASRRTRQLRSDGLPVAPPREDGWNARVRILGGRAEIHTAGVFREGGDPGSATRTAQLGASGSLGKRGWYSGAEYHWDRRLEPGTGDRRLALHAGRIASEGRAFLVRLERSTNDRGRDALQLAGEAGSAVRGGGRITLEPRLAWDAGVLQQAAAGLRGSIPVGALGARVTGSLACGASRDEAMRTKLTEVSLGISLAPRVRDRGTIEMRRASGYGAPSLETYAVYELESRGDEVPSAPGTFAREGVIEVRVVHSGNRTGVPDALVSLDGKEFRFTGGDGIARFERVAPGLHLVALEERSLPANHEAAGTGRAYVTLERDRATDFVQFEITRPARRREF